MKDAPADADGSSGIQTYLRIRPSPDPSGFFAIDDVDENRLVFRVPKDDDLIVNNTRTTYGFAFNGILEEDASQDQVFKTVGAPAVRNALEGFNSTVFAYGQTGSGKTFTITGGPERYADRGIIPRAISMLFNEFQKSKGDTTFSCYASYLELYNENGYDLLAEEHSHDAKLEDMPRVTMLEDEEGNYHFKNLSVHPVASEEDALNLLFLGDTNRAIGETEMNEASSRSHCIFTLLIEGRRSGSDTVTRSKLNLVDLAGSERVHRTSSAGQTLREAKYINSSLFYLEMVIVALHEKSKRGRDKTHVPYRNSMMTSVLRDSLGGNCKTIMIATISPETKQTDESISTCNFAQRVALVKNTAQVNEDLEPELIIRRLKAEIQRQREEIKFLKGENGEEDDDDEGALSPEQREDLTRAVQEYVDDSDARSKFNMGSITLSKIQAAYEVFKGLVLDARELGYNAAVGGGDESKFDASSGVSDLKTQIASLKKTLQQRDQEVAILVKMVKKGKGINMGPRQAALTAESRDDFSMTGEESKDGGKRFSSGGEKKTSRIRLVCGVPQCFDSSVLDEPSAAFSWFRERYPGTASVEENKTTLKEKYKEAKNVGEVVQKTRSKINHHKAAIEHLRRSRALDSLSSSQFDDDIAGNSEPLPEENQHREAIDREKEVYKNSFHRLRELKGTIEHVQRLVEKGRAKMQSDFDIWYRDMCGESQDSIAAYSKVSVGEGKVDEEYMDDIKSPQMPYEAKRSPPPTAHPSGGTVPSSAGINLPPGVKLTGNKEADEDIIAFYKAKEALLSRTRHNST